MIRTTLLMAGAAAAASLAAPRPTAQAFYAAPARAPAPGNGAAVMRDADGLFRVEGRRGDVAVAFVLDTGATATVLAGADARRLGIVGQGRVARLSTAGGSAPMRWARLHGLSVAGRMLPPLDVVVAQAALPHSLLGQDAIAALGRLTIERDRLEIGRTAR